MPCLPCLKRKGKEKYTLGDSRASPSKTPPQQPQVSDRPEQKTERTPSPEKVAPPITPTEPTPVVEESVQKAETILVEAAPPVEPEAKPTVEAAEKVPEKEPSPEVIVFEIPDIPEDLDDKTAFELALSTLAKLYELRPEDLTPEMSKEMEKLVSRLEKVADRLEATAAGRGGGGGGSDDGDSEAVIEFDAFLKGEVAQFIKNTIGLGGSLVAVAALVEKVFNACRDVVYTASKSKRPNQNDIPGVYKDLSAAITEVQDFREKNRKDKQFSHLSALSEAIPALGWVAVSPKPTAYVQQMVESAQFYSNKVLKEFKESDPKQADWAKELIKLLKSLGEYVKTNHGTGLAWNPNGSPTLVKGGAPAAGPPPPPAPGAPAPPPPPPVMPPTDAPAPSKGSDSSAVRAALFTDLNKGTDVTKGLKKVTDDMKTHKNPALRVGPTPYKKPVTAPKPASPKTAPKPVATKPPKLALEGKKWLVEYQEKQANLHIPDAEIQHTIYVYKCNNSTLKVNNKVNSIILDNCKSMGLLFDSVISSVEFVNCKSVTVQCLGKCSIFNVDKTDGCQIYLSKESVNAEIITAKSSEMNISVPKGDDGDYTEYALPEQYKSQFDGKGFKTECTDIA